MAAVPGVANIRNVQVGKVGGMTAHNMTVRFYRQRASGPEEIGTISLQDGRLVADPPQARVLLGLLAEPLRVYQEDGPPTSIDPLAEPEAFLKGCLATYHGSYFWCKEVTD